MNDLPPSSPTPRNQPLAALRSSEPGSPAADEVSLQTKASIKPRAAFLLPQESFDAVYGVVARTELEHLMTFLDTPPGGVDQTHPSIDYGDVEALFTGWYSPALDGRILDRLPALRIVFHAGGSVKSLVTDEFWNRGLRITCTARANAVPVAEYTFAQIILSLKHVWTSARATRQARQFVRNDLGVPSCYGSTVGIISVGLIGRMVIDRLRQLDVAIICHDPYLTETEARSLGIRSCSLEEVCSLADVISCHAPLLAETRHLLRERHFASMKPGASFINTARGGIVHELEMIAVLERRPDLLAVLDVTDPEPPLQNSRLFTLPNVLVTPHIAGSIGPECRRMGRMIIDEVRRYRRGETLIGEVGREQLPLIA
jgi:phosphoglycerate dehydrogenase-like enzyme